MAKEEKKRRGREERRALKEATEESGVFSEDLSLPYMHRDVITLKGVSELTSHEIRVHKEINQILQPGVLTRTPSELFNLALSTGNEWLIDIACLTPEAELAKNIAADLVVKYKVAEKDYQKISDEIYDFVLNRSDFADLKMTLQDQMKEKISIERNLILQDLREDKPVPRSPRHLEMLKDIIKEDKERNKISDKSIKDYLTTIRPIIEYTFKLKKKGIVKDIEDISILGAPASGKSTMMSKVLGKKNMEDYIVYSTDQYRAFKLPMLRDQISPEEIGKNSFVHTQDWAYIIKEEVSLRIKNLQERPNILCDLATFDRSMQGVLSKGKLTSAMAGYSGEAGFVGIAERADARARLSASPGDKGRYINTKSLLEAHANGSNYLLTSIPTNTVTTIYDTKKSDAPVMAKIDPKKHTVEIYDLKGMADLINKRNIETSATNPIELLFTKERMMLNMLNTHPDLKARGIMDLVPANPKARKDNAYDVIIFHEGEEYMRLSCDKKNPNKIIFDVTDPQVLKNIGRQTADDKQTKSPFSIEADIAKRILYKIGVEGISISESFAEQNNSLLTRSLSAYDTGVMKALDKNFKNIIAKSLEQTSAIDTSSPRSLGNYGSFADKVETRRSRNTRTL